MTNVTINSHAGWRVPIPAAAWLFISGVGLLVAMKRRVPIIR